MSRTIEHSRLEENRSGRRHWKRWGPYVSDRQWGTVREDYSTDGSAWDYFTHDDARSRTYRWGEDGLAGFCDELQRLCMGLALWNGRDPILKERLFGLTNSEGNHGEDVKELYYHLDATPTHSYLKMLYKYPQAEFPYRLLVDENRRRGKSEREFELLDTGIFDDNRYFDVFIEYARADVDDILMRVTVHNRGDQDSTIHVLPHLWFRNTWSWRENAEKPSLAATGAGEIVVNHSKLHSYKFLLEDSPTLLFTENESNTQRLWGERGDGYFKDAFHEYVVHGRTEAVNHDAVGTKAAAHYGMNVPAGQSVVVRARLVRGTTTKKAAFGDFDATFDRRIREADEFYEVIQSEMADEESREIQRQAFAGLIWSKQFFYYDVPQWLRGDPTQPEPPESRRHGRNHEWMHLNNADILSVPDKWEYPWYAAWDLAFHTVPFAMVDAEFAKQQLVLLTREWYMHPNGQLPAYEWAFGDVNPPVHAWATWRVFQMDRKNRRLCGEKDYVGDLEFLERVFHKLMLNFTWWVNRKDAEGRNIFQGGFLGMDNIGVFDRSAPLPTGGHINQADGTAWMAMYSLNLLRIALELAQHNHVYEDIATKFFEHFLSIAEALTDVGGDEACRCVGREGLDLWDDEDSFFYDVLSLPDGRAIPMKVRSMVGLVPLFAVETLEPGLLEKVPEFRKRLEWYLNYRPDLAALVSHWSVPREGDRRLLALLRGHRMKCVLRRMLDETEFLSDYGVRSISRYHKDHPYVFNLDGHLLTVNYQPAESDSGLFGGNSNWRGPIWFPMNYLIIESLEKFHHYYGDDFKIECPTGSGNMMTIAEVADELSRRLCATFRRDERGRRPVFAANEKLQSDPHFRDYILFHEYFDGDNGRGVGANHQCGWTALAAKMLMPKRDSVGEPTAGKMPSLTTDADAIVRRKETSEVAGVKAPG